MTSSFHNHLLLQTTGFLLFTLSKVLLVHGAETPLYQSNPADVVRNLMNGDTYEEIYLKYHQCVWSEYGNNADGYDGNGCGGDGNDNYWYMGRTPCYRANVAYSLYGVPKGQKTQHNPCRRKQYINSFFTTHGVETFAGSMGIENYGDATDQCTVYSNGGNNNNGDDGYPAMNNARLYPNYSSYTTTCTADGDFVQSIFQGAYCTGSADNVTTLGELEVLNSAVANMGCVQVWNSSVSYDDDQNNNNNNNNNNDDEQYGIYGLLSYSDSCSPLEYPNSCPDPFKAKHSNEFRPKSQQSWWNQLTWMDHVAWVLLLFSGLCFFIPFCSFGEEEDDSQKKRWCFRKQEKQQKQGFRQWFRTKVLRRRNQTTASTTSS
jgi:hypothetical protein